MAHVGDEMAAGGGGLRASHADRERVIDVLKAAFAQARLTKDEFDARVGSAFASRTYAELAAVTAGIPAALTAGIPAALTAGVPAAITEAQSPGPPVWARARQPVNPDLRGDVRVILTAGPIAAVSWLAVALVSDNAAGMPLFFLAFIATVAALRSSLHGTIVLVESRLQRSSRFELPPPPEPGEWLLILQRHL